MVYTVVAVYCFIVGACMTLAVIYPDEVPPVKSVSVRMRLVAYENHTGMIHAAVDEEIIWEQLQPSLLILKEACPEAEQWVRAQHANQKLSYTWGQTGYYAAYHPLGNYLIINESTFKLNNGDKAVVLAHEFRHSRQIITKHIMSIALVLLTEATPEHFLIVEHEAERFQDEVSGVIFRR